MNKMVIASFVVALVALGCVCVPASAWVAPSHVPVTFYAHEHAVRTYPNGTLMYSWEDDWSWTLTPSCFSWKGEMVYNTYLPDLKSKATISSRGAFDGWGTYTSLVSGLPIKDIFKGTLILNKETGTMTGTFTQYGYVVSSWKNKITEAQVKVKYPWAVYKMGKGWLVGITVYTEFLPTV